MPAKSRVLKGKALAEFEAKRNLAAELLESILGLYEDVPSVDRRSAVFTRKRKEKHGFLILKLNINVK